MNEPHSKIIRYNQRLTNLKKSYQFLLDSLAAKNIPTAIQNASTIKAFEMSFDLSWKCLKDYLEYIDILANNPRDIIKEAFQLGILKNGHEWIELLDKRNQLVHLYDEKQSQLSVDTIQNIAVKEITQLIDYLDKI
jgi:nucleotidyltransferase substrate binding protein (TIGR01987 family)